MSRIAFFDLDGTLTEENVGIKFTKRLYEEGCFRKREWDTFCKIKRAYERNDGNLTYNDAVKAFSTLFALGLEGMGEEIVQSIATRMADDVKYVPYCLETLNWLRAQGFNTVLISASPIEVIQIIAFKLGFEEAYGLRAEVKNGIYTGKCLTIMTKEGKKRIVTAKLSSSFSMGIGDTLDDMEAYSSCNLRILIQNLSSLNLDGINDGIIVIKDLREIRKIVESF